MTTAAKASWRARQREGIEEGVNLTVLYDNSQADGGTASQIATNFAGKGVDLMCGIATPMAQAEYGVAEEVRPFLSFSLL